MSMIGQTIGAYQIVEELGRGGMAVVYKAFQPSLNRYVALKVLPDYFQHDPEFVARFKQEAQAAAQLSHPNIVVIYDVGEEAGVHYIAMEYLEGGSLHDRLDQAAAQGWTYNPQEALSVVEQVGSALDYAHSRGLIHRDIKPANILFDAGGRPKVTDFGIARAADTARLTRTGVLLGTPEYMSPEQASGGQIDQRSDLYALGVMAYEMLTGRVPFQSDTPHATLHAVVYEAPPPPRQINPGGVAGSRGGAAAGAGQAARSALPTRGGAGRGAAGSPHRQGAGLGSGDAADGCRGARQCTHNAAAGPGGGSDAASPTGDAAPGLWLLDANPSAAAPGDDLAVAAWRGDRAAGRSPGRAAAAARRLEGGAGGGSDRDGDGDDCRADHDDGAGRDRRDGGSDRYAAPRRDAERYTYAERHTAAERHAYRHNVTKRHTDRNPDADADQHADGDTNTDAHADTDGDPDANVRHSGRWGAGAGLGSGRAWLPDRKCGHHLVGVGAVPARLYVVAPGHRLGVCFQLAGRDGSEPRNLEHRGKCVEVGRQL